MLVLLFLHACASTAPYNDCDEASLAAGCEFEPCAATSEVQHLSSSPTHPMAIPWPSQGRSRSHPMAIPFPSQPWGLQGAASACSACANGSPSRCELCFQQCSRHPCWHCGSNSQSGAQDQVAPMPPVPEVAPWSCTYSCRVGPHFDVFCIVDVLIMHCSSFTRS